MDRAHRAFVSGVHRLQHVERLAAATLADDDPVGSHPQGVAHKVANLDRTLALDVGGTGLKPNHVRLPELKLGRVLDRDDPLVRRDEAGEDVEKGRLA